MPKRRGRSLQLKENARKAREVRRGKDIDLGGFRVNRSKTEMDSVPGLQRCAELFGNAGHPDVDDFPNEAKNPGDSMIRFRDALSQSIDSKGDVDHRPTRILYKLESEQEKKGKKGKIVVKYPFVPTDAKESTKKKHIAMVAEIKRRGYRELEGMFGLDIEEDMEITKISLIAYGSRQQMLHKDMTVDHKRDLSRGTVAPGSMIFNLQGGSCRLGVVYIGDTEDENDIGQGKGFRHFGGICCKVEQIGKGCFAWLDADTVHYGAVHSTEDGACVRLHVEFKKRSRVAAILAAADENNYVRVVTMSELLELHDNSTVPKIAGLQKEAFGRTRKKQRRRKG